MLGQGHGYTDRLSGTGTLCCTLCWRQLKHIYVAFIRKIYQLRAPDGRAVPRPYERAVARPWDPRILRKSADGQPYIVITKYLILHLEDKTHTLVTLADAFGLALVSAYITGVIGRS